MNIIDHIVVTPEACKAWREAAKTGLAKLRETGVQIREIGTEEAYEQPDGSLVIQCKIGEHVLHLRLPSEHWSHAN